MTQSSRTDLCSQPTQAVSTEKYAKLVYDSTTQLHQPIQSILSALDQRANALTKLANFESALRDAIVMQQISPSSALGYIRAATIYSEQGKQRHVIDVCNKGLMMVDPSDMHYDVLSRTKSDAEQHEAKGIDFVSQLPFDIVTTTLIPMFVDTSPLDALKPCSYLHVSNLWRDYILQRSDGLCFKTTYNEKVQDIEKRWQLIEFSRHIKELRVYRYCDGTWLSDLLCNNDFSSLRDLCIYNLGGGYNEDLVVILGSLSRTLTHLAIDEGDNDMVPIDAILSPCRNLVSLSITQRFPHDISSLAMTTWPNITTLSINYTEDDELSPTQIIGICQRFPALTNFDVHPFPDIESILMVPRYCPLLNCAKIEIHDWHITGFFSNESTGSDELVVKELTVYEDDWFGNQTIVDTAPVLNQYHATLEHIEWDITPDRDFQHLYNIEYPRLRKLQLRTSGSWILQHAPILEELMISATAINDHPEVLHTIPSTLEKLELKLSGLRDKTAIERYLQLVPHQCQLQELSIEVSNFDASRNVLMAIPRITTLQHLVISFGGKWKSDKMERFFDGLADVCPNLSCLEIDAFIAPSAYSINALKRLERLQRFTSPVNHTGGYDSFWYAIQTFSQLSCIRLYPESNVNMSDIQRLKEHRRGMNIMFDHQFHLSPFQTLPSNLTISLLLSPIS